MGRADARRGSMPSMATACSMSVPARAWLRVLPCNVWGRVGRSSPSTRTKACWRSPNGWHPALDIRRGTAEHLPIGDAEIDCVTCQFALMFFYDPSGAVAEMRRVIRPGGRVAVATWAAVEESPGYAAMVELLAEEIGDWAADALRAPFCLGTPEQLGDVLRSRSQTWQWSATTVKLASRHSTTGCTPRSGGGRWPNTSMTTSTRGCGARQRRGLRNLSPATGPCDSRRLH